MESDLASFVEVGRLSGLVILARKSSFIHKNKKIQSNRNEFGVPSVLQSERSSKKEGGSVSFPFNK